METGDASQIQAPDDKRALGHYFRALDGIRALMAVAIVAFHSGLLWVRSAPMTMDLFFVISGFLITGVIHRNVQRSGQVQLLTFWKRRLLRLYPALLLVVASGCVVAFVLHLDMQSILKDAWQTLLYVSDFPKLHDYFLPPLFAHSWSLSVEEQFYLCWPILLFFALKCGWYDRRGGIVLIAIALADVAWRNWLLAHGEPWSRLYYAFDTRIDGFIIGGLLALGWDKWRSAWQTRDALHWCGHACALGLLAMFVCVDPGKPDYFAWKQELVLLFTAGMVLLLASPRASALRAVMEWPVLVTLGSWCYAIYLWHWPIIWLLQQRVPQLQGAARFAVVLAATLLLAGLTHRFVERRIMQRRTRYVVA